MTPTRTAHAPNFPITKAMQIAGFAAIPTEVPRMAVASSAHEKYGKSTFAAGMPGSIIAALSTDPGTKVLQAECAKYGKSAMIAQFADSAALRRIAKTQGDALKEWRRAKAAAEAVKDNPAIKSVFVDTGGGFWELCRLAILGKLEKVIPTKYADANNEMEEFFGTLYDRADLNILVAHKLKKKYNGNEWDGKSYTAAAYEGMKYLVDVNVEHTREMRPPNNSLVFGVRVIDSRWNAAGVAGLHLTTHMPDGTELYDACTFTDLALSVWPSTDESYWA